MWSISAHWSECCVMSLDGGSREANWQKMWPSTAKSDQQCDGITSSPLLCVCVQVMEKKGLQRKWVNLTQLNHWRVSTVFGATAFVQTRRSIFCIWCSKQPGLTPQKWEHAAALLWGSRKEDIIFTALFGWRSNTHRAEQMYRKKQTRKCQKRKKKKTSCHYGTAE